MLEYPFDFGQYHENTRHLDSERFKSMHRIDYWTGYHGNRGAHKALIKRAFNWLELTNNFVYLFEIKKCGAVAAGAEVAAMCQPETLQERDVKLQTYA